MVTILARLGDVGLDTLKVVRETGGKMENRTIEVRNGKEFENQRR